MADIQHEDVTSVHRGGYVANSDPGAVGADIFWTDTSTTPHVLKVRNAGNTAWDLVGEVATATNVGTDGSDIFKQKTGSQFEFRKIRGGNINVQENANDVSITVNESQMNKPLLQGYFIEEWALAITDVNNPVGTAVISQYGGITWTYDSTGTYIGTFSNALPLNSVTIQVTPGIDIGDPSTDGVIWYASRTSSNTITLRSYNVAGALANAETTQVSVRVLINNPTPWLSNTLGFNCWYNEIGWGSAFGQGWENQAPGTVIGPLMNDGGAHTFDVDQSGTLNGYPVVQFSDTTNDGVLVTETGVSVFIKEVFIVMRMREATFSNFAGIITGTDTSTGPVLVGDTGETKFLDLSYTGLSYKLDNVLYATNDMQAPMNTWGIIHMRFPSGWALDELQVGSDRDFAGRFAEVDIAEIMLFSQLQSTTVGDQIYTYLSDKWAL